MDLNLSKTIPAHRLTVKARWCRKDFCEMGPKWRHIRGKNDPMNKCYWCKKPHNDGDMMALANFIGNAGNRTLCQSCADELISGRNQED